MTGRKKRGSRRKMGVKRYPSGQIINEKPDEVALKARMRVFGVSKTRAKTREAGHVLGVPLRQGEITQVQFDAGAEYLESREQYRKSIISARMRSGSDFGNHGGGSDSSDGTEQGYVAFCERSGKRYRKMRRAVLESGALSMLGLETWLDHTDTGQPLPYYCLGDYRIAANAICKIIGFEKEIEERA